jgi:hypothetical protein
MPIIVRLAQRLLRPCAQNSQWPQVISGLTVTGQNFAGDFVAENQRGNAPRIAAVIGVHVRSANADRVDPD